VLQPGLTDVGYKYEAASKPPALAAAHFLCTIFFQMTSVVNMRVRGLDFHQTMPG